MNDIIIKTTELCDVSKDQFELIKAEFIKLENLKEQMLECYRLMNADQSQIDQLSDDIDIEVFTLARYKVESKLVNLYECPRNYNQAILSSDYKTIRFCS